MTQINRTHTCGELAIEHLDQNVTIIGWLQSKRNLGSLLFLDIRDHYGITQVVINQDKSFFEESSLMRQESVVQIRGTVKKRSGGVNSKIKTGEIEVIVDEIVLESACDILPFPIVNNTKVESEDTRLTYRYLDLRTEKMHKNILFRSKFIKYIRDKMFDFGFYEFTTPILTSSSPEGARDFLVPSRLHPGHFYALPQAPQQFKQILMCSGFDKYFQIAPCFRDEDPRADRAPGEFYQLDIEMCFATQDNVFDLIENLMGALFNNPDFSSKKILDLEKYDESYQRTGRLFPCIPWSVAMEKYGSDKPDLRFGLEMQNVEDIFVHSDFNLFKSILNQKGVLKAIVVENSAHESRKFFDDLDKSAKEFGLGGLPWVALKSGEWKGSVAKQISDKEKSGLQNKLGLKDGSSIIFILGEKKNKTLSAGGKLRNHVAEVLNVIDKNSWAFAWIVDFPMYEFNEDDGKIDFSHNPFSMPQGGVTALETLNPLNILAYQYDIVCNGVEIASGAIRNHKREVMKKAFALAGYSEEQVEQRFGALWNAFNYGAPPHGGIAPGIDRMIMLLLGEPNIREVIAFPLNQRAMDLMMGAPSFVGQKQMDDVHVKLK